MKTQDTKQAFGASALKPLLAMSILAVVLTAWSASGAARNPNPGVIPPDGTFRGLTYGEWGAQWWSTVFSIPVVEGTHPLISGGAFGGDKGVVFLSGAFGAETVELEVTIPAGSALFFPVVNTECSVLEPEESGFHGDNEAELRTCANGWIDGTADLSASIDGVAVNNLQAYRSESPLFEFTLPEDNIFEFWSLEAPGGTTSLSVDAGVYLLLTPLTPGQHTIHFEGTFTQYGGTINTTYHITVK